MSELSLNSLLAVPLAPLAGAIVAGLFGKPTAINNVETRYNVLGILDVGGQAFAGPLAPSSTEIRAMLATAVNRGVNHVEVGRGDHNAEEILHKCGEPQLTQRLHFISRLREIRTNDPRLAATTVEAQLERSFAELGRRKASAVLMANVDEAHDADGASLAEWLAAHDVSSVDVVGIATDYCVRATALAGLHVHGVGHHTRGGHDGQATGHLLALRGGREDHCGRTGALHQLGQRFGRRAHEVLVELGGLEAVHLRRAVGREGLLGGVVEVGGQQGDHVAGGDDRGGRRGDGRRLP